MERTFDCEKFTTQTEWFIAHFESLSLKDISNPSFLIIPPPKPTRVFFFETSVDK